MNPSTTRCTPLTASLRGEGVCLRPYDASDAPALADATRESAGSVGRWMPWCIADYDVNDARAWITDCTAGWANETGFEFGIFSEDGTQLLGGAGLNQFNEQNNFCNLGYWVRESRHGQGIATRAVKLLADFGFDALGLTRIEIVVAEGNEASRAVAAKVGARVECLARNRLMIGLTPRAAWVHSLVPERR